MGNVENKENCMLRILLSVQIYLIDKLLPKSTSPTVLYMYSIFFAGAGTNEPEPAPKKKVWCGSGKKQ
jgi:hypothetical protein